jgi:hypothetical protein
MTARTYRRLALLAVTLWLVGSTTAPAPAAAPGEADALPPDLDLVPRQDAQFLSVRVADLWYSDGSAGLRAREKEQPVLSEVFLEGTDLTFDDFERVTILSTRAGTVYVTHGTGKLNRARVVKWLADAASRHKLRGRDYYINEESWTGVAFLDEQTFVCGPVNVVEDLFEQPRPEGEGPLTPALRLAAGKHHVVFGLNLADALPEKDRPKLSTDTAFLEPLLHLRQGVATVDCGKELEMVLRGSFADDAAAREAVKAVRGAKELGLKHLPELRDILEDITRDEAKARDVRRSLEAAAAGLKDLDLGRDGTEVKVRLRVQAGDLATLPALYFLTPRLLSVKTDEPDGSKTLVPLADAMLRYHKDHGRLPASALFDRDGKPLLSWRVELLPYLGEKALYKQFHLDEPWDSAHNRKLISKMPKVFVREPFDDDTPTTPFQVFVGKGTLFEGKEGLRLADATDGPANTLLIAEASRKVPWTKPEDLPYAADRLLPGLGRSEGLPTFGAAFADGQVMQLACRSPFFDRLAVKTGEEGLRAVITRNGGEKVDRNQLVSPFVKPRPR